ncbi:AAA family ATPase [Veillonella sp.]|uniref:AAA family ATPase n=1 Tax=Veillonella sp. TaxID=1926307 RepID=UPI001D4B0404|nr:AAA family ATPase [Veillonella sp.]MBS6649846.1 AAA family ATPase [Veillonella sp.]
MGYFDDLSAEEQVSYLIKPILEVLSQASTPLKTSEIRSLIIQADTKIAEFANTEYTSKRTRNTYNKFTIKFGLALKELIVLDIVERQIEDKTLVLTSTGRSLNLELLDVQKEIREKAQLYWKEHRNKSKKQQSKEDDMNKEASRRICRAISNSEASDFSWYKMKVGDIVTYKYESVDDSYIGEFGLGYNVNGGETEEQISSAVSCIFQVVDYTDVLDVSEKDTSKKRNASKQSIILKKAAVLRCVHVFNEPISKACLDDWLDGSGQINLQGGFICITDEKANKIIEKIKELAPHLSTDIDNKNIILPEDYKQKHTIQVMYYGAPGTGKSYSIASLIKKSYPGYTEYDDNPYVFRTTIYRDYSYYDFVGNIMPVTKEGKVSYEFVPGIFTTALCTALRTQDRNIDVYLILEEMSRGDIASIFGDIFQLLDRDNTGKSMYGINNKSIYEYLILNGVIKAGHKIIIPSNLHIIGTVNTSDQNVNVIDTAFKRRFDFKYIGVDPIPIHVDGKDDEYVNNFDIKFTDTDTYEWVKLYQAINHIIINDLGLAEDKQLGPFFLKDKGNDDANKDKGNDDANREQVADKLLHYLWQDVERVSYTGASLFDDSIKSFSQLYSTFKHKKNILSEAVKQAYGNL